VRQQIIDRWVGVSLIVVAAVWSALAWTTISPNGMPGAPGPRAFPLLLGGLLAVLGIVMVATSLAKPNRASAAEAGIARLRRDEIVGGGGGLALFLSYAFLMDKIGFLLATPLVVILALRLILRIRNWLAILLVAAGLTTGCYVVFGMAMQANLPHGSWIALTES
jgi:putative tricarboxylic transport membrane protein